MRSDPSRPGRRDDNETYVLQTTLQFPPVFIKMYAVPASQLSSAQAKWATLDEYVAKKAYVVPYGYQASPKFTSNRIDFGKLVFNPLYGNDFSSLQVK